MPRPRVVDNYSEAREAVGRSIQRAAGAAIGDLSGTQNVFLLFRDFDNKDFTASDGATIHVKDGAYGHFLFREDDDKDFTDSAGATFQSAGEKEAQLIFRTTGGENFTDSAAQRFKSRNA